jgi:hypothetical protein
VKGEGALNENEIERCLIRIEATRTERKVFLFFKKSEARRNTINQFKLRAFAKTESS